MQKKMKWVAAAAAVLAAFWLGGCQMEQSGAPQAYWFSNSYTSFWPDGDSICFRADDGLYRWQPGEEQVSCIAGGLFDSAERVYLAAVDGDYFYTQRLDPLSPPDRWGNRGNDCPGRNHRYHRAHGIRL